MRALAARRATIAGAMALALCIGEAAAQAVDALPPPAAASPAARALQTRVLAGAPSDPAVRQFYEQRGFAPLWLGAEGEATPAARALLDWSDSADAHALAPARYGVAGLRARLASAGGRSEAGSLELALTRLYLAYARDLASGLLEPRSVSREIDIAPPRPDPAALLSRAAAAPDVAAFLAGLTPAGDGYRRLLALYRELREIARAGGWGAPVADGPTLRLGDRGPRVEQVRARLLAMGDLPLAEQVAANEVITDARPALADPRQFDTALEAAVRRFQARHGLNTDGAVGPMTLAALNVTADERAEQVAVNLERLRWLNRDLGFRHVVINTAAFTMTLYEGGAPRFQTRTVVGKAGRFATPEFNDQLEYIVVNPTWNVPRSIAVNEILPELRKDSTYLARNNMELIGADLPASMIDWSEVTRGTFPGRLRQRPGPDNALGAVKFLFPNRYSIYMHDTPARKLFLRDRRDFSHGCVRLEDPVGFAHLLLSLRDSDPEGTFARLRALEGERWVTVAQPIPVYVTYRTAWVADDGSWQFRADVYGRDRKVAAALRAAGVAITGG